MHDRPDARAALLDRLGRVRLALLAGLFAACGSAAAQPAQATVMYKIVTASDRGTYIQIGRDLARFVAPQAGIQLEALPSKGSADNVSRLRYDTDVKLAIVQSDVYQAFLDYAARGNSEASDLIRPLRVVLPLYDEEIYFVVRADSPLQFVHDIHDARINIGPLQSGTAMSASTIYRLMFAQPLPDKQVTTLTNEEALVRLTTDRSIDVVAIVAGQPAKLLADMKPEAKQLVRLLKVDPKNAATRAALQTYVAATIRSASYPNWLDQDVDGLAVKAYLVTYDYSYRVTVDRLAQFARSLCQNFPLLQTEGHPKWRDVRLALPALGKGWTYYGPTERALRSCGDPSAAPRPAAPASRAEAGCTQQEQILGLCRPH
ncbi:MAG: TAXI family TRAP transporter solute-binding subunit [Vitreoscilla sp.]